MSPRSTKRVSPPKRELSVYLEGRTALIALQTNEPTNAMNELSKQFEAFGAMLRTDVNTMMNRMGTELGAALRQVRERVDNIEAHTQWERNPYDLGNPYNWGGRGGGRHPTEVGEPSHRGTYAGLKEATMAPRGLERPTDDPYGWPAESKGSHHLTPQDPRSWANTSTPADREGRARSPGALSNEAYQTGRIPPRAFERGEPVRREGGLFDQAPPHPMPNYYGDPTERGETRGHGQLRAERWKHGLRNREEPPFRHREGERPEPNMGCHEDWLGPNSPRGRQPQIAGRPPLYGRANLNPFHEDNPNERNRFLPHPRFEFPTFQGEGVHEWLCKAHQYFTCQQIPRHRWGHKCKANMTYQVIEEEEALPAEDSTLTLEGHGEKGEPSHPQQAIVPQAYYALSRDLSPNAMQVGGTLGKLRITILVDTGATHNFISQPIAIAAGCKRTPHSLFEVMVGGGSTIPCLETCEGVDIQLQGIPCRVDLLVLSHCGADVILGVQWIKTLEEITFDFKRMAIRCYGRSLRVSRAALKNPWPTINSGLPAAAASWPASADLQPAAANCCLLLLTRDMLYASTGPDLKGVGREGMTGHRAEGTISVKEIAGMDCSWKAWVVVTLEELKEIKLLSDLLLLSFVPHLWNHKMFTSTVEMLGGDSIDVDVQIQAVSLVREDHIFQVLALEEEEKEEVDEMQQDKMGGDTREIPMEFLKKIQRLESR
ncbi:hypothetical protein EJ110_NYTH38865 [Nymphaea thermarum]|nr:hypothetical protein EJ110_NYTH38865 [Nymphaea thermarum]